MKQFGMSLFGNFALTVYPYMDDLSIKKWANGVLASRRPAWPHWYHHVQQGLRVVIKSEPTWNLYVTNVHRQIRSHKRDLDELQHIVLGKTTSHPPLVRVPLNGTVKVGQPLHKDYRLQWKTLYR